MPNDERNYWPEYSADEEWEWRNEPTPEERFEGSCLVALGFFEHLGR
jgi:hypothetical protein